MRPNQIILNDFITKHPFSAAKTLEAISDIKVAQFLEILPVDKIEKLLMLMNTKKASDCFSFITAKKSKEFMETADVPLIAALLKPLDIPARTKLLNSISADRIEIIKRYLSYLPNSVATLMENTHVVNKEMTAESALKLFKNNQTKEDFYLYVIDLDGDFKGIVRLKELFSLEAKNHLNAALISNIPRLLPDITIKKVLEHAGWHEFQEFPVIDSSNRLLGKLTRKNLAKYQTPIKNSSYEIEETGNALGELFRIGLNGLLQGGGNK